MRRIQVLPLSIYTIIIALILNACTGKPVEYVSNNKPVNIFPDYTEVTIPANIAPLNFMLLEESESVYVEFSGKNYSFGFSSGSKISIPAKKWENILDSHKGDTLKVTVYFKKDKEWIRNEPFSLYVDETNIDGYLVYRLIPPGYISFTNMSINQRNISNFSENKIVSTQLLPGTCINCHSFRQNNPDQMLFHVRSANGGTMLIQGDRIEKLNTKTAETISNCVYPYWHPSGKYVAFSVNSTFQSFHAVHDKRIEVSDTASNLVIYDIESNTLLTDSIVSSPLHFETFPTFTPDGLWLIFASAKVKMPEEYDEIRYDLCRVAFDPQTGRIGQEVDTLVHASREGLSVSFPRVSPDGRFLMFTMSDYGNFSIWHKSSDLYLMDMQTGQYQSMSVNSDDVESYHSWSSDSRWFVFSSRRLDGLYTRPYIAAVDENGELTKPFILPQKNPDFYSSFMLSFNVPEFINEQVNFNPYQLEKVFLEEEAVKVGYKNFTETDSQAK